MSSCDKKILIDDIGWGGSNNTSWEKNYLQTCTASRKPLFFRNDVKRVFFVVDHTDHIIDLYFFLTSMDTQLSENIGVPGVFR